MKRSILPFLDAGSIAELVPVADAIACLRDAFARDPAHVERTAVPAAGGDFLVMPAVLGNACGAKLLMVQPQNAGTSRPMIQGTYVLFDAAEGRPVALLDGAALTRLRTPAVSMIAALPLARREVRSAIVIGQGPQGLAHAEALRVAFPRVDHIRMLKRHEPIVHADLVVAATSSAEPILSAQSIAPGTHVTLVGSYRPERREASADLIVGARVFVDEISAARHEAGDLIGAVADGSWTWDQVAGDLVGLARGDVSRLDDEEITVFKSVGLAVQDLAVAMLAGQRAGVLG